MKKKHEACDTCGHGFRIKLSEYKCNKCYIDNIFYDVDNIHGLSEWVEVKEHSTIKREKGMKDDEAEEVTL